MSDTAPGEAPDAPSAARRPRTLAAWSLLAAAWFGLNFFALFPAALLCATGAPLLPPPGPNRWFGAAILVGAHVPLIAQLRAFIEEGRGTQLPLMPPDRLVRRGLYARVRNPMYWNYVLIVLGEAVLYRAPVLIAYAAALFALAHVYVVHIEEPQLRRRFGADYDAYCARVPRWLPRRSRGA